MSQKTLSFIPSPADNPTGAGLLRDDLLPARGGQDGHNFLRQRHGEAPFRNSARAPLRGMGGGEPAPRVALVPGRGGDLGGFPLLGQRGGRLDQRHAPRTLHSGRAGCVRAPVHFRRIISEQSLCDQRLCVEGAVSLWGSSAAAAASPPLRRSWQFALRTCNGCHSHRPFTFFSRGAAAGGAASQGVTVIASISCPSRVCHRSSDSEPSLSAAAASFSGGRCLDASTQSYCGNTCFGVVSHRQSVRA